MNGVERSEGKGLHSLGEANDLLVESDECDATEGRSSPFPKLVPLTRVPVLGHTGGRAIDNSKEFDLRDQARNDIGPLIEGGLQLTGFALIDGKFHQR